MINKIIKKTIEDLVSEKMLVYDNLSLKEQKKRESYNEGIEKSIGLVEKMLQDSYLQVIIHLDEIWRGNELSKNGPQVYYSFNCNSYQFKYLDDNQLQSLKNFIDFIVDDELKKRNNIC